MTPAVNAAKRANIDYQIHSYEAGAANAGTAWGNEAAVKLGLDPERVFKTLITQVDQATLVVGIVPVTCELKLKAIAANANGKRAEMAARTLAERATGYVLGGISPLGQRQSLLTLIDDSAKSFDTIFVSGGRRGLELELSGEDLLAVSRGRWAQIARRPK